MNKYPKIQTVWLRDPETKHKFLLEGEWATPEFAYLQSNLWIFTEKVDGTNIRVNWDGEKIVLGGRTDNAQIPAFLVERLYELFQPSIMTDLPPMTLYGEGYGAKIQKGGGNYKSDGVDFVLFDVLCGGLWLKREDVSDIALTLAIDEVPVLDTGDLHKMIDLVSLGFDSEWGDFPAEGIVARPATQLMTRTGELIITKLKAKDFPQR